MEQDRQPKTELIAVTNSLGSAITSVVEKFAKNHDNTKAVSWYHDEPVWLVFCDQGDILRRVQIAAFRFQGAAQDRSCVELRIIPSVLRMKEDRVAKRQAPQATDIRAILLVEMQRDLPEEFSDQLEEAWLSVLKMDLP